MSSFIYVGAESAQNYHTAVTRACQMQDGDAGRAASDQV